MSIKVGVRVRPFNQRQSQLNCRLCVAMQNQTTQLINLDDPTKNKNFTFDYSFWSHDNFQIQESGYFRPTSNKYADQELVYNAVGKQILDNAWQGFNCCLFAYGQTGSGKSYSMIGYGANKGIVPIACEEIFKRIDNTKSETQEFEVSVSMMEIYNEKVQDLLIPVNKRAKEGLKIREHKTFGVFVEGLSKHYVNSYESIQNWMEEGNTHRSVAATEMNANSSRAHTIITIDFTSMETMQGQKVQRRSIIYLVDLAGSERIEKTGAAGLTLIQATNINKSLSVLGRVIENLANKAMGKNEGLPPYRESALTRILQNALGGNSKTLMICAVSPATDNYDQTMSTLKYADQAKKIQNKAIVNENQTDKMIRELTQQNQKLKNMMDHFNKMGINLMDKDALEKFQDIKSNFNKNIEFLNPNKSDTHEDIEKVDVNQAHLINLHEDPLLSKKIKYSLVGEQEKISIGRKNAEPLNDVIVGGVGIDKHHAIIWRKQDEGRMDYYLTPLNKELSNCFINGEMILNETRLFNSDRIIFGTSSTYLIIIPGEDKRIGPELPKEIDYEFAQQQLLMFQKKDNEKLQQQQKEKETKERQEHEKKLLQKQLELEKMKQELQQESEKSKQELHAKTIAEKEKYEQELERMKLEIENEKKKLEEASKKNKSTPNEEKQALESRISRYIPKTIEMNLIAKEFHRNIHTELKLSLLPEDIETDTLSSNEKFVRIIKIHVENKQLGYIYNWDIDKFNDRYQQIKYLWEKYLETNELPKLTQEEDPFYDPPVELQIGSGFLTTLSLPHLLDNETELSLVHDNGECGTIFVNLIPTDEEGEKNLSNEIEETEECFEPDSLIGEPLYFKVVIEKAKIPDNYSNIYVEYDITTKPGLKETFKTKIVKERVNNPKFNYSRVHKIDSVTKEMIDMMLEGHICFKVYGQEFTNIQPSPTKKVESPNKSMATTVQQPNSSSPNQKGNAGKPVTKPLAPMSIQTAQQDINKKLREMKQPEPKKEDKCLLF